MAARSGARTSPRAVRQGRQGRAQAERRAVDCGVAAADASSAMTRERPREASAEAGLGLFAYTIVLRELRVRRLAKMSSVRRSQSARWNLSTTGVTCSQPVTCSRNIKFANFATRAYSSGGRPARSCCARPSPAASAHAHADWTRALHSPARLPARALLRRRLREADTLLYPHACRLVAAGIHRVQDEWRE